MADFLPGIVWSLWICVLDMVHMNWHDRSIGRVAEAWVIGRDRDSLKCHPATLRQDTGKKESSMEWNEIPRNIDWDVGGLGIRLVIGGCSVSRIGWVG